MVDLVYACAKFKYECGNYSEASEYLYFYRVLVCDIYHCSLALPFIYHFTVPPLLLPVLRMSLDFHCPSSHSSSSFQVPFLLYLSSIHSPPSQAPSDHQNVTSAMWGKLT